MTTSNPEELTAGEHTITLQVRHLVNTNQLDTIQIAWANDVQSRPLALIRQVSRSDCFPTLACYKRSCLKVTKIFYKLIVSQLLKRRMASS